MYFRFSFSSRSHVNRIDCTLSQSTRFCLLPEHGTSQRSDMTYCQKPRDVRPYDIQGLGPMWINLADHNFARDGTKSHHPWRPPSPKKAKKEKKNRERKRKYAQYFFVTLSITLKHHVYGKRQTSDSSWEFLKIENEQIKRSAQNNSYGWKIAWNY